MHLCGVCEAMQPILYHTTAEADVPAKLLKVHQETICDIIAAWWAGCYICTQLYDELETEFPKWTANEPLTWCVARARVPGGGNSDGEEMMKNTSLEFWIKKRDEKGEVSTLLMRFRVVGVASDQAREMRTSLQPRSTKELALNLAGKWMETCMTDHAACRGNSNPKWYPTRLLELRPQNQDPVLIQPGTHPVKGSYACLSHCWGTTPILRLLLSNHASFQTNIPYTLLPITFRQTIDFCLALGLHYLWIDSLCIIQDSESDWRAESAVMDDIYRNAILCLSASGAQNATEGLYFPRDSDSIDPLPPCPNFQNFNWRERTRVDRTWHIYHPSLGDDLFSKTRTIRRCWIFQERMLSARILHFAREQIFWECGSGIACETFPLGFPPELLAATRYLPKAVYETIRSRSGLQDVQHKRLVDLSNKGVKEQMGLVWGALVTEYTRGVVSKEGDKLVALGGMARSFWGDWKDQVHTDVDFDVDGNGARNGSGSGSEKDQIRYIAGLWSHHLPQDLLWKTISTGPRPGTYRAPTWSWASVDGRIEFDLQHWKHEYVCTASMLDIHVEYVESPWGQVRAGYICIKGPVCRLKWAQQGFNTLFAWPAQRDSEERGDKECVDGLVEILPDEKLGLQTQRWGDVLYGLLVLRIKDPGIKCRCVVVLSAASGAEGVYHRVGIVKPIVGRHVACWFDKVAEKTVKIV